MRILIIEDNLEIANNIADFLESRSHIIDFTSFGRDSYSLIEENEYDAIVLDLMLPDIDGLQLCRNLRSDPIHGTIPILMLTARDTLDDKLTGFQAGADDYLVKPFSLLELEARLNALVKRRSAMGQSRILEYGDIRFDLDSRQAYRGERELNISGVPKAILKVLLRANGRTVPRSELTQAIWGDHPPNADALSVHIHALRNALHESNEEPVLQTIRGEGYRLSHTS